MANIRIIDGKQVDLDKAAKDLGVPKETLTKNNASKLQAWLASQ